MNYREVLKSYGFEINDEQANKLDMFREMLVEKNKVMNLTAITEKEEVEIKHFLDSLSIVREGLIENGKKVLDIGTGAGFPGIPLAICFPDVSFTLLDSLNKRIVFLQEVIEKLGLKNVEAVHGRAEEYIRINNLWEKYDLCVSRAVARLVSLLELSLPYVKKGGYFIAMKASSAEEELSESKKAISVLGGKHLKTDNFEIEFAKEMMTRNIIVIKKEKDTDRKYPRAGGKALSKPLV